MNKPYTHRRHGCRDKFSEFLRKICGTSYKHKIKNTVFLIMSTYNDDAYIEWLTNKIKIYSVDVILF